MSSSTINIPEEKDNNFQNYVNLQQQIMFNNVDGKDNINSMAIPILSIDGLFELLEKNFNAYHNGENLKAILPLIHFTVRAHIRRFDLQQDTSDIGMSILYLYEEHKEEETDLMIVVQITHQILHSLHEHKEFSVGSKIFVKLAKQLSSITERKLISNIIACLQLYVQIYPNDPTNNELFHIIWTDLSGLLKPNSMLKQTYVEILIQLFDEFCEIHSNLHCDDKVILTIQFLLQSNQRENRKCGYYLFKKMMQLFMLKSQQANNIWFSSEYSNQMERSWISYITILENLEENQSHLILPSLQNLTDLIKSKQLNSSWMDILYMKILTHKNNLVLRWSIAFFLDNLTCSTLSKDVQRHLLEALNSNILYNSEGYFIEKHHFESFLKGDLTQLYELLSDINWKAIPLHNLLTFLNKTKLPSSITLEQLIKISSRVRALQDFCIRQEAVNQLNNLFYEMVDNMNMEEYVTYVEALYNVTDRHNVFKQFYKKKTSIVDMKKENAFKGRFYEVLAANIEFTTAEEFTALLQDIPLSRQSWLKFLPFHFKIEVEFLDMYDFNIAELFGLPISTIIKYFDQHLCCDPKDSNEREQRHKSAIAFYVQNVESLDKENDLTLEFLFDSDLSENIIQMLCCCLSKTERILEDWAINKLIDLVGTIRRDCEACHFLCQYLEKNKLCQFIDKMLEKCPKYATRCQINILSYIDKLDFFCGDIKKGESRIEESYRYNIIGSHTLDKSLQILWQKQILLYANDTYAFELLQRHKEITKKKQRYFANSYEHRTKTRIAFGLANILTFSIEISGKVIDELWDIVLNENNQLNIDYLYEYIIGKKDYRQHVLLKKLQEAHTLTSSQQISIVSIIYKFCMTNKKELESGTKNTIVTNLMAMTMGANFNTRLFAQVALYKLLNDKNFEELSCKTHILESIEAATRGKLNDHLNDIRFIVLPNSFTEIISVWSAILYVTSAPYDELVHTDLEMNISKDVLDKCRLALSKKIEREATDHIEDKVNDQLQRKMNPPADVIQPSSLHVYPMKEKYNQMYVIASLIDKLPNLGGIARTCEVLGIQNLVLDAKKDIEKNDFKNLSMTAEKFLNIIEVKQKDLKDFIINKQKEGFSVVGAEQTSNSEKFGNFKFPQKCVLLLGHEKDGIPPNLLGLLDHAVEISQFGQVRSLNVHVTGALFMWEYCKQHFIPSS